VEVECSTLEEGIEAGEAGADIVMFDNFDEPAVRPFMNMFNSARKPIV